MPDFYYATHLLLAFKAANEELYIKYENKTNELTLEQILDGLNRLQSRESSVTALGLVTTVQSHEKTPQISQKAQNSGPRSRLRAPIPQDRGERPRCRHEAIPKEDRSFGLDLRWHKAGHFIHHGEAIRRKYYN